MLLVLACSPVGYRCCENTERYPTGVAYRCIVSHVVHTKKLAPMATRVREGVACVVFEGQIRSGQQNGCRPGGVGWRVLLRVSTHPARVVYSDIFALFENSTIQGRMWDASLFFASVGRMVPSCQWGRILLLHGRKNGCFSINCVEEHS